MNPRHPQVSLRAGNRCEYCRAPAAVFNFLFEVEHITPLAREGTNDTLNLALACRACNAHKGARLEGVDPEQGLAARLFHPRRDVWEHHFCVEAETAQILGVTSEGRATVACLDMNNPLQCAARRYWLQLGLFS